MENEMLFNVNKNVLKIIFKGEIDHQRTLIYREKLISKIDEYPYREVYMDFKDVTFIDSSGIGMILGRYNQLNKTGGKLYFTELSDVAKRLFELSGLFKIIEIKGELTHV